MGFAKEIEQQSLAKWSDKYVDYVHLKEILRAAEPVRAEYDLRLASLATQLYSSSGTDADNEHFISLKEDADAKFEVEMQKVSVAFVEALEKYLSIVNALVAEEIQRCEKNLTLHKEAKDKALSITEMGDRSELSKTTTEKLLQLTASVEERGERIWQDLRNLFNYVELNYKICYKAIQKHDKMTGFQVTRPLMEFIEEEPFMKLLSTNTLFHSTNIFSPTSGKTPQEGSFLLPRQSALGHARSSGTISLSYQSQPVPSSTSTATLSTVPPLPSDLEGGTPSAAATVPGTKKYPSAPATEFHPSYHQTVSGVMMSIFENMKHTTSATAPEVHNAYILPTQDALQTLPPSEAISDPVLLGIQLPAISPGTTPATTPRLPSDSLTAPFPATASGTAHASRSTSPVSLLSARSGPSAHPSMAAHSAISVASAASTASAFSGSKADAETIAFATPVTSGDAQVHGPPSSVAPSISVTSSTSMTNVAPFDREPSVSSLPGRHQHSDSIASNASLNTWWNENLIPRPLGIEEPHVLHQEDPIVADTYTALEIKKLVNESFFNLRQSASSSPSMAHFASMSTAGTPGTSAATPATAASAAVGLPAIPVSSGLGFDLASRRTRRQSILKVLGPEPILEEVPEEQESVTPAAVATPSSTLTRVASGDISSATGVVEGRVSVLSSPRGDDARSQLLAMFSSPPPTAKASSTAEQSFVGAGDDAATVKDGVEDSLRFSEPSTPVTVGTTSAAADAPANTSFLSQSALSLGAVSRQSSLSRAVSAASGESAESEVFVHQSWPLPPSGPPSGTATPVVASPMATPRSSAALLPVFVPPSLEKSASVTSLDSGAVESKEREAAPSFPEAKDQDGKLAESKGAGSMTPAVAPDASEDPDGASGTASAGAGAGSSTGAPFESDIEYMMRLQSRANLSQSKKQRAPLPRAFAEPIQHRKMTSSTSLSAANTPVTTPALKPLSTTAAPQVPTPLSYTPDASPRVQTTTTSATTPVASTCVDPAHMVADRELRVLMCERLLSAINAHKYCTELAMTCADSTLQYEKNLAKQMFKFYSSILALGERLQGIIDTPHFTQQQLHEAFCAVRLQFFLRSLRHVTKSFETTQPETASALEALTASFWMMFGQYMSHKVDAPDISNLSQLLKERDRPPFQWPGAGAPHPLEPQQQQQQQHNHPHPNQSLPNPHPLTRQDTASSGSGFPTLLNPVPTQEALASAALPGAVASASGSAPPSASTSASGTDPSGTGIYPATATSNASVAGSPGPAIFKALSGSTRDVSLREVANRGRKLTMSRHSLSLTGSAAASTQAALSASSAGATAPVLPYSGSNRSIATLEEGRKVEGGASVGVGGIGRAREASLSDPAGSLTKTSLLQKAGKVIFGNPRFFAVVRIPDVTASASAVNTAPEMIDAPIYGASVVPALPDYMNPLQNVSRSRASSAASAVTTASGFTANSGISASVATASVPPPNSSATPLATPKKSSSLRSLNSTASATTAVTNAPKSPSARSRGASGRSLAGTLSRTHSEQSVMDTLFFSDRFSDPKEKSSLLNMPDFINPRDAPDRYNMLDSLDLAAPVTIRGNKIYDNTSVNPGNSGVLFTAERSSLPKHASSATKAPSTSRSATPIKSALHKNAAGKSDTRGGSADTAKSGVSGNQHHVKFASTTETIEPRLRAPSMTDSAGQDMAASSGGEGGVGGDVSSGSGVPGLKLSSSGKDEPVNNAADLSAGPSVLSGENVGTSGKDLGEDEAHVEESILQQLGHLRELLDLGFRDHDDDGKKDATLTPKEKRLLEMKHSPYLIRRLQYKIRATCIRTFDAMLTWRGLSTNPDDSSRGTAVLHFLLGLKGKDDGTTVIKHDLQDPTVASVRRRQSKGVEAPTGCLQRLRSNETLNLIWYSYRPACVSWLSEYKWRKHLGKDIVAGFTIGVLLIPQGLACATLAGVPPVYGVYTGFPAVVYALLGTSRQAAIGPMSIPSLLMAGGITAMAQKRGIAYTPDEYLGLIMAMTLLCGILLLFMGILNLGFMVRFISRPVLSGFTSAAAIITMLSVMKDILGAYVPRSQVIQDYVAGIVKAIPNTHLPTFGTSLAALFLLLAYPSIVGRIKSNNRFLRLIKTTPPALINVVLFILIFLILMRSTGDSGIVETPSASVSYITRSGIALVGSVPASLPRPVIPKLTMELFTDLIPSALSITFVGFIESIAIAKNYALKHGYDVTPSTELKALGITNILGSFTQCFLVMGAFGRSAVNEATGATSQISGLVSALTVLVLLTVVMPALFYLPKPALSAIIMVAVRNLVDYKGAIRLWRIDKKDMCIMLASFLATLFLGVSLGVVVSMALSLVVFIALTTQPRLEELGRLVHQAAYEPIGQHGVNRVYQVKVLRFSAPLFFANSSVLKDRILKELRIRESLPPKMSWKVLILCFSAVSLIDSTAIQTLEESITECHERGVLVLIAGANMYVEKSLALYGFYSMIGKHNPASNKKLFLYRRVYDAANAWNSRKVTHFDLPIKKKPISQSSTGGKDVDGKKSSSGGSGKASDRTKDASRTLASRLKYGGLTTWYALRSCAGFPPSKTLSVKLDETQSSPVSTPIQGASGDERPIPPEEDDFKLHPDSAEPEPPKTRLAFVLFGKHVYLPSSK